MPVTPTYPGVYVEEIPSGVRSITGVSTSVTAFVGYTKKGPVNKATRIFDFGGFERHFGGLSLDGEIGYAVQQFFLNGGAEAWIVRVAASAVKAAIVLQNGIGGTNVLDVTASGEGIWGNYVRLDVDYNTSNPDSLFNLAVSSYTQQGGNLVLTQSEMYRNLSMNQNSPGYAPSVINPASQLVQVARDAAVTPAVLGGLPAGWSMSGDLGALALPAGLSDTKRFISITVDGDGPYEIPLFPAGSPPTTLNNLRASVQAAVRAINPGQTRFSGFAATLVNALGATTGTRNYLLLTSGAGGEQSSVVVGNASSNSAASTLKLGMMNGGREREAAADLRPAQTGSVSGDLADQTATTLGALNPADTVQMTVSDGATQIAQGTFSLGSAVSSLAELATQLQNQIRAITPANPAFSGATVQVVGTRLRIVSGTDAPNATIAFANAAGGLFTGIKLDTATDNVQRYSLGTGATAGAQTGAVSGNDGSAPTAALINGDLPTKTGIYALEDADIFNLLCIPRTASMANVDALAVIAEATAYCESKRAFYLVDPPMIASTPDQIEAWVSTNINPDNHSAIYYPAVLVPDPLQDYRLQPYPPSGTVAGVYARTDTARGVWKAPAGIEATLGNVQDLAYHLTDAENGALNPIAINCLRSFPVYGRVVWGARTLRGADALTDDYKYVPVRRLALFLEESLYRGTKWVVFEPNDEPLWSQIRLNVGAFMHGLFTQGAFAGQTADQAYFVKCDKQTTTPTDQANGIVNIIVGFSPLRPAEFVIIQIQQIAAPVAV